MKRPFLLLWGSLLGGVIGPGTSGSTAAPGPVSLVAEVDRSLVAVGEEVFYTLTVTWARGQVRNPQLRPPDWTGFQVLGPDTRRTQSAHQVVQTFVYRLRPEQAGEFSLGPAQFDFHTVADEEPRTVTSDPSALTVVDVSEGAEIRDIKELLPIPVASRWGPWIAGGTLTAIGLLGVWFTLYHRRRGTRQTPLDETGGPPPLPPQELVRQELAALDAARLPERGRIDEYHIRLSEIVRRYLAARWAFPALESTTAEIQNQLMAVALPEAWIQQTHDILRQCDWEKFGTYQPSRAEMEAVFAAAERWIGEAPP